MLFFNRPKPKLCDLIPPDYIDIHSHLLPGIDDGATDPEHSLGLIKGLREHGFSSFITTPHIISGVWDNTKEIIQDKETKTKSFLKENGIESSFKASAEYMMDEAFYQLFKKEKLLTLKDDRVLIEMSYLNAPINLHEIVYDLQVAGYKPVLAHPERYVFYHNNFDRYKRLKKAGCEFQINLLSTVGYYGKGVLNIAEKLLSQNMIDFTGSDVHHERHLAAFKNGLQIKSTDQLKAALKNNALFK